MKPAVGSAAKILIGSFSSRRRRELALVVVLMPLTAIAETAMIAAIVPFVALLTGQPGPGADLPFLTSALHWLLQSSPASPPIAAALLFGCAAIVAALLRLALAWTSQHFTFGAGHDLAVDVQHRLLRQPYSFHLRRHSSETLATLDKVDHLIFNLLLPAIQSVSAALIGLFVVGFLLAIDPIAAGIGLLLFGSLFTIAMLAVRRGFARHAPILGAAHEQRLRAVQESVGAIRDVILDQSQPAQIERFAAIDRGFMEARTKTAFLAAAPRIVVEAAGLLLVAGAAILIAGRSGNIEAALPILGALALGAYRLLPLMSQIYSAWAHIISSRPIMTDVADLLSLPVFDDEPQCPPLLFSGEIRFEQVSFLYPDRVHPALHDISLAIPSGSRVAVTGHSGSGKSTFADLLMGLIRPTGGRILVDGAELIAPRLPGWRRSIAHVPQSIFLADANIAANIALAFNGVEPDMGRVQHASRLAQLDDFVQSLPQAYATSIGENGVLLSGGQRQRLALARALYKQAPVLVLDEATSALDDATEKAVLTVLDELQSAGCTVIIIAHRTSTIATCDRVLALKNGRMVQWSSFRDELGNQAIPPVTR